MGIYCFIIDNLCALFSRGYWLIFLCTIGIWGILYFKLKAGHDQQSQEEPTGSELTQSCSIADPIQNQDKIPVLLPVDLIEQIADCLFEIIPPMDSELGRIRLSIKPSWGTVAGFMGASIELHNIGMKRWVQVLTCNSNADLENAAQHAHWVREIQCFDQPTSDNQYYGSLLNKFNRLHTLSLDLHSDIYHNGRRFAYRDVFTSLPSSLRRLEIKNAHGPDVKIIATVKKYCPEIQELRLGRCNMFNRSPACRFWRSFPFEHDSYISNDGTDEYASSLAQELAPLRRLKTLEVGIYLIPTSTALAHRIYHAHKLPAPDVIDWQLAISLARDAPRELASDVLPPGLEPASSDELVDLLHQPNLEADFNQDSCQFCRSEFLQASVDAELSATTTLKSLLPSLSEVQWQGWFTPNHLGLSTYSS